MGELKVFKDENELVEALAQAISSDIQSTLARQSRYSLVLSGGKTPEKIYSRLAESPFKDQIPWDKVHLFMGDERFVPPDHADSNYRMVRRALLEKIHLPPSHMHAVPTQTESTKISAMEYERELKFFFGDVPFPRFDLVLLGVGEDGHTASLFPGTEVLEQKRYWVATSNPPGFVPGTKPVSPLPGNNAPYERVTLTFPSINNARRIIFIVTGSRKSAILKEVLHNPSGRSPAALPAGAVENYPAQRVQPVDGKLEWWVDKAAQSSN